MTMRAAMFKRRFLYSIPLMVCTLFPLTGSAQQQLQGSYCHSRSHGCMWFSWVDIHLSKEGDYRFSLALGCTVPRFTTDYQIYGKLSLNKATGHYEYLPPPADSANQGCGLEFIRDENQLTVRVLGYRCKFRDLTLSLTNPANPEYFRYRDGVVSFSTPPESFFFVYKEGDLMGGN